LVLQPVLGALVMAGVVLVVAASVGSW